MVRDWLHVVIRHRWLVLAAVITAPLLAYLVSHRQHRLYQASAQVLVSERNPTATALNVTGGTPSPPDRYAATQASLARVAQVAEMTARAANLPGHTAAEILARSTVTADANADILTFSVSDPVPPYARRLANTYATEFTLYRRSLDSAAISQAIADAQRKLTAMVAAGRRGTALYSSLQATTRELEELQTVQATTSSATVVDSAGNTTLTQPRTKRNVALGILVGLALGLTAAFLRESLDTRVRSAEELRDRLGLTLLGRVPRFRRKRRAGDRLPTLSDGDDAAAEAFAIAATNLETARHRQRARSILVTSVERHEGKATTAANLAVTLARSGRHVVLLDLDLGHPAVDTLFGLSDQSAPTRPGSGSRFAYSLNAVDLPVEPSNERAKLEVLALGRTLDAARFLLSHAPAQTLADLGKRCDLLLINAPPLASGSHALAVATGVDALVVVGAVNRTRRASVAEAQRVLQTCATTRLGLIATYETRRSLAAAVAGLRRVSPARAVAHWGGRGIAGARDTWRGRGRATAMLRALGWRS